MTEDEQLLHELAAGSDHAFERIFDAYADFVFSVALRRTGSTTEAEDITAEVFSELWRQRQDVSARHGSLRPWLAGTASNLTRRYWRSAERRNRVFERLRSLNEVSPEDLAEQTVSRIEAEGQAQLLRSCLMTLPPEQYAVLTLSVWEELSHAEIAEALGIAVGTVKSRLSRARRTLKQSMGTPSGLRALPSDRPMGTLGGQQAAWVEGGRS